MEEEDLDRVCDVCGEADEVEAYSNLGVGSLRCRRHSVGLSEQAEEIYWQRRSSSLLHELKPKQQAEEKET
jgi:hypothetical protein